MKTKSDFNFLKAAEGWSQIKGACSDPQPHPPAFFKHIEILVPNVESYLEGFVCEFFMGKPGVHSLGEISKKPSWKL